MAKTDHDSVGTCCIIFFFSEKCLLIYLYGAFILIHAWDWAVIHMPLVTELSVFVHCGLFISEQILLWWDRIKGAF